MNQKSGLCTASMVLGIICLVTCLIFNIGFLPGLLGAIFGIVCLVKRKEPRGRAIAGLITSVIGLIIGAVVTIILVVILLTGGLMVGAAANEVNNALKEVENETGINVWETIENGEYNQFINENGEFDEDAFNKWYEDKTGNSIYDDYNNNGGYDIDIDDGYDFGGNDFGIDDNVISSSSNKTYDFNMGTTAFEDIEQYGYKYEYGDSEYRVYSIGDAQFEFPAYVYNYKQFGDTHFDAYMDYITKLGIVDNDDYYYDDKLYTYGEWEYAIADQISVYDGGFENGGYENYEVWLFAFNDESEDMVILIGRPTYENYEEDVNKLMELLNYMTYQGNVTF